MQNWLIHHAWTLNNSNNMQMGDTQTSRQTHEQSAKGTATHNIYKADSDFSDKQLTSIVRFLRHQPSTLTDANFLQCTTQSVFTSYSVKVEGWWRRKTYNGGKLLVGKIRISLVYVMCGSALGTLFMCLSWSLCVTHLHVIWVVEGFMHGVLAQFCILYIYL